MNTENKEIMSFAGTSTSKANKVPYSKIFEEVYNDDGTARFISRERFLYPGEEGEDYLPKFEYQYFINVVDMGAIEKDNNTIRIELSIIPCQGYVHKKIIERIQEDYDTTEMVQTSDLWDYLNRPIITTENFTYNEEDIPDVWYDYFYNPTANNTVIEKLDCIATILPCINARFGYYMDKYNNYIGTTGWDLLKDDILGKDFLQEALKRFNI